MLYLIFYVLPFYFRSFTALRYPQSGSFLLNTSRQQFGIIITIFREKKGAKILCFFSSFNYSKPYAQICLQYVCIGFLILRDKHHTDCMCLYVQYRQHYFSKIKDLLPPITRIIITILNKYYSLLQSSKIFGYFFVFPSPQVIPTTSPFIILYEKYSNTPLLLLLFPAPII